MLWALDPLTGQGKSITPDLASDSYAGDPAISPDGTTIAFTIVVVPAPNPSAPPTQRVLPGSDLWLMNSDGSNRRQLFVHDKPGLLIEMPVWTPDGKGLVYTYSAPILGTDGRYTGSVRELQRLDIATGQRTTLVKDGEDAAFAPAGGAAPSPTSSPTRKPSSSRSGSPTRMAATRAGSSASRRNSRRSTARASPRTASGSSSPPPGKRPALNPPPGAPSAHPSASCAGSPGRWCRRAWRPTVPPPTSGRSPSTAATCAG